MLWKVWDGDWSTPEMVARAAACGASAFQNGYRDRGIVSTPAVFNAQIQADAVRATAAGMVMHQYNRTTSVDYVSMVAAVVSWPSSLTAFMFDSEISPPFPTGYYNSILTYIPTSVAIIAPDSYPGTGSATERDHTGLGHAQYFQQWSRITGWYTPTINNFRRMTDLSAGCYNAARYGVPLWIGAQAWSTDLGAPCPKNLLQASIYLVALTSSGKANGTHWGLGANYCSQPTLGGFSNPTWDWLKEGYETVNALDWTGLTDERARVGLLIDEAFYIGDGGTTIMWEMMTRANIPFEVIWDEDCTVSNLEQYDAIVVPALTEDTGAGSGSGTFYSLSTQAQYALRDFAACGKPVLTQCGDVAEYGNVLHYPLIPTWCTTLLSARWDETPFKWYPTFGLYRGEEGYVERVFALIQDYRAKVGITPHATDFNTVVRKFLRAGAIVTVTVNTDAATISMSDTYSPTPPYPTPPAPTPTPSTPAEGIEPMLVSTMITKVLRATLSVDTDVLGDKNSVIRDMISEVQQDWAKVTQRFTKIAYCSTRATGGEEAQSAYELAELSGSRGGLPYDYIAITGATWDGKILEPVGKKHYMARKHEKNGKPDYGDPKVYWIENDVLRLWPVPNSVKELRVYYPAVPNVIAADTESLVIRDTAAILNGVLARLFAVLKDEARTAYFQTLYDRNIKEERSRQAIEGDERMLSASVDMPGAFIGTETGAVFL